MKKLVALLTSCFVAGLFSINVQAQGFITPLDGVQLNTETIAIKTDGTVIKAKLKATTAVFGYIKK